MWPFKKRLKFICPSCGYVVKLTQKRFQNLSQEGFIRFDHKNKPKIECHMCHMAYMVSKNTVS